MGTPSSAKRSATVDLPLAMPPVRATRKGGFVDMTGTPLAGVSDLAR
jgi:hypothetical protein